MTLIFSLLTAGLCCPVSALVIHEGDFGFEVNVGKQEATLVSYRGTEESVILPSFFGDYPVRVIGTNAFSGNETIKEVIFSDTNTTVEEYAFMDCISLETVVIPENVVSFDDRVFANCIALKNVTLLSEMVSMPTNMFSGCSMLSNLTISDTITDFSYGCFNGCSSLTNLDFVKHGDLLGSYSFNGTGAQSVILSESLLAIPNYAFTRCPNLEFVTIPESVVLIQPYAFDWENVTIRCFEDSYAHLFAVENNLSFELIRKVLLGDANNDGYINISDVTAIQRHLAELELLDEWSVKAADVNQNGSLVIEDATELQMFLAEYELEYPIGQFVY